MKPFLPLGFRVEPYGEVSAIGITGGERYYWFTDKHHGQATVVSMIPASMVEPQEDLP